MKSYRYYFLFKNTKKIIQSLTYVFNVEDRVMRFLLLDYLKTAMKYNFEFRFNLCFCTKDFCAENLGVKTSKSL